MTAAGIIPGEFAVIEFLNGYPERVVFVGKKRACLSKARQMNKFAAAGRTYHVDANVPDEPCPATPTIPLSPL